MIDDQPKLFAHKIQHFAALPRYYGGDGSENEPIKAAARLAALVELGDYVQRGLTYSVRIDEDVRAPLPQDAAEVAGVFVVTITTIAIIDTLF